MRRPGRFRHLDFEIAHAVHVGHRPGDPPALPRGDPVLGCGCPECSGLPADHPARRLFRFPRPADPLPVESARAVSTLTVAKHLGIRLRRVGRSWRGPCPIHDGDGPNFSILEEGGARCWSCGWTGDGIALWMELRTVSFVQAVNEIATLR